MGAIRLREQAALVALLQARPMGVGWAEITADVLEVGSALEVWHRLVPAALMDMPGEPDALEAAAQEIIRWTGRDVALATILDENYPARLRAIHQAPPVLFARGALIPDDLAVSVVGSRKASDQGLAMAGGVARELVARGVSVIAGLALGIDTAAHRAALAAGGRTVAVIGTGIRRVYPAENRKLQEEIAARGLLLSQFWPDAPPQKHTFLIRNATMSGYGLATVVVEAVALLVILGVSRHAECPGALAGAPVTHWASVPSLPAKPGEHPPHKIVSTLAPGGEADLSAAPNVRFPRDVSPDHFSVDARAGTVLR